MACKRAWTRNGAVLILGVLIGTTAAWLYPQPEGACPVQPPRSTPLPAVQAPASHSSVPAAPLQFKAGPLKKEGLLAPAFIEIAENRFEAVGPHYRAILTSGEGLTYLPAATQRAAAPAVTDSASPQLQVRFAHASRGTQRLYDRASDPDVNEELAVSDATGSLSFWRTPELEERYTPRGDGVEQLFVLDEKPDGAGDLTLTCELNARGLKAVPTSGGRNGGILFADERGRIALRYGQVVVHDVASRGLVLEPRLAAEGRSVSFSIPAAWLEAAAYPVVIDPLVGGDFFVTPDFPTTVGPPTLAASNNGFLVVWTDYFAGLTLPTLMGSVISGSGLPGPAFPVSSPGLPLDYRFQRISAASDGSNWLVVWADDRPVGAGVRGAIVTASGAVLDGTDFGIALTSGAVFEDPLVVFNGIDYVVAWHNTPPSGGSSQIFYTRVTTGSVVGVTSTVPASYEPINQALLFLAPQRPTGDTLLIYRENNETPAATRSVRIGTDGTVRDPGGTTLFKDSVSEAGFGSPIGAAFVNGEWQILSSFEQGIDSSIYLHRLSTAGVVTPPTGVFAEMGVSTSFVLNSFSPAFAGAEEWLLVRPVQVSAQEYHIVGKRVTFAGVDMDPIPFQIDTATTGVLREPVAASAAGSFLTVWLDGRDGGAQPGDARDVAGALVSESIASTPTSPLLAVASASPTSGEPPLIVNFDGSASQGTYDTLVWDFGDGSSATTAVASHTYKVSGVYNAVLKLKKGSYTVLDRVVIKVGQGSEPLPGGGTQVGAPALNSPGMVTELFISSALIRMPFEGTGNDVARIYGLIDPAYLTGTLTGSVATCSISDKSFEFTLDAKAQSVTTNKRFGVNLRTGAFSVELLETDLQSTMAALGATNATVKPAQIINVPITLSLGTLSAKAVVGANYRATLDKEGVLNYGFLGDGKEVSGSFLIKKFSSKEQYQSKTQTSLHSYSIKGQLVRPDGLKYKPGTTGNWQMSIGNFTVLIPVGQFQVPKLSAAKLSYGWPWDDIIPKEEGEPSKVIKFVGRAGVKGLKKFTINPGTGAFSLQMVKVPAGGDGGSGMPSAKAGTNVTLVDLNLSFVFDLSDGTLSAGRYIFIQRKDPKSTSWKLRE